MHFRKIIEWSLYKPRKIKKNVGKLLVLAINALLISLAALAATFSAVAFIVTFYNDAKPPTK